MKIKLAAFVLAAAPHAFAAEPPDVSTDRALACADIADAAARLECFDRSVAGTRAAAPQPSATPAAPVQPSVAAPAVVEQQKQRENAEAPAPDIIQARV